MDPCESSWPTPLQLAARRWPEFVIVEEPGRFRAIPRYEITADLAEQGCLGTLSADTLLELEQRCTAERMKRSRVLAGEHTDAPGA